MSESESFDPFAEDFARDPYPHYARLLASDLPEYYPPHDTWLVSRFDQVTRLVKDRSLTRTTDAFSTPASRAAQQHKDNWHDMPHHERFVQFSMLDSDGDVHDRLRKQVFAFFGPAPVARLRDRIRPHIERLVAAALAQGTFDFVEALAAHIPGYTIGALMGVPQEDCAQIRRWSEDIVQYFDVDRSDERKALAEASTSEFYEYLQQLTQHKTATPADDLISRLIEVEQAGHISHDEFYSTCMLIVMAGHGSTLDVMGSGLYSLLMAPDQMARLRADPGLMKTAIQEMFRYQSPLPFFHRYASEPIDLGGQHFERGTRFGLLYGAANRDESVFADAHVFDVGRWPNRHLAFGGGAHFCLGNHLARLSMDILFGELLAASEKIRLVEEPLWKPGLSARGVTRLLVDVR